MMMTWFRAGTLVLLVGATGCQGPSDTGNTDAGSSHDSTVTDPQTPSDTSQSAGAVSQDLDGSWTCQPAGTGPFPAILYNHGGLGMKVGGDLEGTCRALADQGYLARSEQRPLTESPSLEGHLDDVLSGLDTLLSHPQADTSRVAIMGFSRGGLLSLQAGVTRPTQIHAIVLMAPAAGKNSLEQTLKEASKVAAPVRIYVSENDLYQDDHVKLANDVLAALEAEEKDVALTVYPPYGDDGHELFFEVQEPYWSDVLGFLSQSL